MQCPCGSEKEFSKCCEPYLLGEKAAPTAEALMRSRYSAFVTKNYQYIEDTVDPQTTNEFNHPSNREWAEQSEFQRLEILSAEEIKNKATVEFKAYFHQNGEDHVHHEVSKFRQQAGIWYFRDGRTKEPPTKKP